MASRYEVEVTLHIDHVHNKASEHIKPLIGSARLPLSEIVDEVGLGERATRLHAKASESIGSARLPLHEVVDEVERATRKLDLINTKPSELIGSALDERPTQKLELKRPSGQPHGWVDVKVVVRDSRYRAPGSNNINDPPPNLKGLPYDNADAPQTPNRYETPPAGNPYSATLPYGQPQTAYGLQGSINVLKDDDGVDDGPAGYPKSTATSRYGQPQPSSGQPEYGRQGSAVKDDGVDDGSGQPAYGRQGSTVLKDDDGVDDGSGQPAYGRQGSTVLKDDDGGPAGYPNSTATSPYGQPQPSSGQPAYGRQGSTVLKDDDGVDDAAGYPNSTAISPHGQPQPSSGQPAYGRQGSTVLKDDDGVDDGGPAGYPNSTATSPYGQSQPSSEAYGRQGSVVKDDDELDEGDEDGEVDEGDEDGEVDDFDY